MFTTKSKGSFEENSTGANTIIGAGTIIVGDIEKADILGKVSGKIKVKDLLLLRGNANVHGDIYAGKLQIEPTVSFNGQCHMGANVVDINNEIISAVNQ